MFTPTSKVFLPIAGGALLLAAVYKILTGDLLGGVLYLMAGTVSFLLGIMLSSVRENEYAPVVPADAPPPTVRPVLTAPLPGAGGHGDQEAGPREHRVLDQPEQDEPD